MAKILDTLKKLSFLGDFSAFLLPLVLIILACLLFVPTTLMQRKLRAQIEEQSIKKGQKSIESLLRDPVSSKQWEVEKSYQDLYQLDANGIALLAEQTSRRPLLSYDIFPEPNETSQQIYSFFGRNYRAMIDKMFEDLTARDCPTQAEIDKHLKQPSDTTATGGAETSSRSNTEKIIRDDLCMAVARSTILYSNKSNFSGYKFWENYSYKGRNDAISDCWYWQLGSWITEDILQTARALNGGSASVLSAPLKRIMAVSFTPEETSSSGGTSITYMAPDIYSGAGTSGSSGRPRYVLSFGDSIVEPFNGRKSNEQVDIVHFRLSVVLSARAIPGFLEELCSSKEHIFTGYKNEFNDKPATLIHNQITILNYSFQAIDADSEEHRLYRYGNDSVVKMDLVCEYAFNKKGYEAIMPKVVKDTINKAVQTTVPAAGYGNLGTLGPAAR